MTDCRGSLFFYLAATAGSWISWVYCPSLGSHHSAVKEHIVGVGLITRWGEECGSRLRAHFSLECRTEMWEREITLSEEYFHSSTLSMLFLLVNLGLAPTGKVNKRYYIALKQKKSQNCRSSQTVQSKIKSCMQGALCLFPAAARHVSIGPMMFSVDMWFRQTTEQTIWIRVCLPALHQRGKCRTWVWVSAQRRVHERKHHTKPRMTVQI